MSAIAMLMIAFATIAVVGTALAAVHDVIAAAISRMDDEAVRTDRRPMSATALRPRVERQVQRMAPTQAAVRVKVRRVDGAVAAARV